jgi:hypothetical protein
LSFHEFSNHLFNRSQDMAELKNKDPELITNTIAIVSRLLVNYGWYVLAVIIIGVIVYHKFLRPLWDQMAERRERMSEG